MALTDGLDAVNKKLQALAQTLQSISAKPIQINLNIAAPSDRIEAEAIKRGQKPEVLAALRRALL